MNRVIFLIVSTLLALLLSCGVSATLVTISNVLPRLDVRGQSMDIHDGNVNQYEQGGLYYYYGAGYGDCHVPFEFGCAGFYLLGDCGFRINHTINLYTSPDLQQWTFVRDIFPAEGGRPVGIYYRPKVVYNKNTQRYVLWVNRVERTGPFDSPNFLNASYVVAASTTPDGVFTVVQSKVKTLVYGNPGDFALLVDEDDSNRTSTAYIAYNAFNSLHRIQIEQLTADFTATLGKAATTGPVTPTHSEAPILFKRHSYYYLLFGALCCFCTSGSNSRVYVSTHPMGTWQDTQYDIDPITNEIVDGILRRRSISGGEESFVIQALQSNSTPVFIFVSDRWGTGELKSHDMQYWQPLEFDDTQTPPRIQQLQWTDQFTLDLAVGINRTKSLSPRKSNEGN